MNQQVDSDFYKPHAYGSVGQEVSEICTCVFSHVNVWANQALLSPHSPHMLTLQTDTV